MGAQALKEIADDMTYRLNEKEITSLKFDVMPPVLESAANKFSSNYYRNLYMLGFGITAMIGGRSHYMSLRPIGIDLGKAGVGLFGVGVGIVGVYFTIKAASALFGDLAKAANEIKIKIVENRESVSSEIAKQKPS